MKHVTILFFSALPLLSACASTAARPDSPEQIAALIVSAVDDQRTDVADKLFEDAADNETHRQQIYPLLYEAAQDRYVRGDAAGAADLLTFLTEAYPDGQAVERALLYSLFLLRAEQEQADPALLTRMGDALKAVRSQVRPPVWTDLVQTQLLIDQGRLSEALDAYERFVGSWDGQPEAIGVYVDDIERYLASH